MFSTFYLFRSLDKDVRFEWKSISRLNDSTNLQINDSTFLMIYLGEFAGLLNINSREISEQMIGDLSKRFCGQSVNMRKVFVVKVSLTHSFLPIPPLPDLSQLKSIWMSVTKEVQTRDSGVHNVINRGSSFSVWADLNFFWLKHSRYRSVLDPICLNYFPPRNVSLQICKAWQSRDLLNL